jgi:anti-sigma-K factor RskA
MSEHTWTEHAAPYALGALDEGERAAFESHLAQCAACRSDVQAFQEVTGLLALAAPPVSAPPQLKSRILAEARQVRPISLRSDPRSVRPAAPTPIPGSGRSARLPWLAAAAMFAIAAGSAGFYNAERRARAAARAEADDARAHLVAAQSQIARSDSLIANLLAPDVQTTTLAARGQPPSARIYFNRARGTVVLAAFDLQPAPSGRTYQLWGIATGQTPVSLGTFNTSADGHGLVALTLPAGTQYNIAAVTEEPAGGSPQPTMQPFLVGTLGQ